MMYYSFTFYRVFYGLVLQLYLQLGVERCKVYTDVAFDQGNFISSWVEFYKFVVFDQ